MKIASIASKLCFEHTFLIRESGCDEKQGIWIVYKPRLFTFSQLSVHKRGSLYPLTSPYHDIN